MEDSAFVQRTRRLGRVCILSDTCRTLLGGKRGLGILFFLRNYLFLTTWSIGVVSPERLHRLYYPGQRKPAKVSYCDMAKTPKAWIRSAVAER